MHACMHACMHMAHLTNESRDARYVARLFRTSCYALQCCTAPAGASTSASPKKAALRVRETCSVLGMRRYWWPLLGPASFSIPLPRLFFARDLPGMLSETSSPSCLFETGNILQEEPLDAAATCQLRPLGESLGRLKCVHCQVAGRVAQRTSPGATSKTSCQVCTNQWHQALFA